MQITEISAEGLKRQFKVVVDAADIQDKLQSRLSQLGREVRLPGFRPGKVPVGLLRKRYGASVMGEVVERAVADSSQRAISERGLRAAMEPKVEITSFAEGSDLEYTMAVELMPDIGPVNFGGLKLERLKVEAAEAEIDSALGRIAQANRRFETVEEKRGAAKGDAVIIDFAGTLGGKEVAGATAKDFRLDLGSGAFVPGFEDQLIGAAAGDRRTLNITFPKDYNSAELAGRDVVFDVTVKNIQRPVVPAVDEGLAKTLGSENMEALRKIVRDQINREYAMVARSRLKRQILDQLAKTSEFQVPQGMVDLEFETIWNAVSQRRKQGQTDPDDAGKSEDELKAEYRKIAERRVRLGLLLSEIGRLNNINITAEETNRAVMDEARRHPGRERQVLEYYRSQPEALAQIRAPLYEDKVIDFIAEMAKVSERPATVTELYDEPEDKTATGGAA